MSLFKKQPKIIQISIATAGDMIFTFGLAKDGQVYSWDATKLSWRLYHEKPVEAVNAEA